MESANDYGCIVVAPFKSFTDLAVTFENDIRICIQNLDVFIDVRVLTLLWKQVSTLTTLFVTINVVHRQLISVMSI